MTRNLKTLGLAIVAVLAMSAMVASAAQASVEFTAPSYPATLSGNQATTHVFTVETTSGDNITTTCTTASFHGTISGPNTAQTITPTYTGCTAFGLEATVKFEGCDYVFHPGATTGTADEYSGTADLSCPAGTGPVRVFDTLNRCEVTLSQQLGIGPVKYVTDTTAGDVLVKAEVTGITYNKVKDNFLCPLTGTGVKSDGKYFGNSTVTGGIVSD